ncbi:MAG: glycosyltransferase family 2 protein [Candidatus Competibacteraceae bacterium]|nr:glycosyltransferase family 2 protein [Candidatus Competibacteraceae bacterium]MBK8963043.1 glycosyltransferase family 2 protein [Candidatus Competibacteraceae bacterium]MBK9953447.1 glycosyltransferase family 2 protein [Candidatus Competibacteraceae bacterium]
MMVLLLAHVMSRDIRKADITPKVTVLIAAFNEEREIKQTVLNKLSQDYPTDLLEILVVSDGSTDRTDEIVRELTRSHQGRVSLLRQEPRQGKTQALNMAVAHVSGEILIFSDANSLYRPDAIRRLVRDFADSTVGYVTGQMVYTNPEGAGIGEGSGAYMRYENLLRALETRVHSVVGVDGGIDAVRRELYVPMRPDQLPDFVLPLNVVEQARRVVYEPEAILYEPALAVAADEFRMRVRVSLRALWALFDKRNLFNPLRDPLFAWQLLSHKVLRYGAFLPLVGLLGFNALAIGKHPFYLAFFIAQAVAYGLAMLGPTLSRSPTVPSKLLAPYYFVILNLACAVALWKFINRQKMVLWKPRVGS